MEEIAERNGLVCEIADPKYGLKAAPGQELDGVDFDKIQAFKKSYME